MDTRRFLIGTLVGGTTILVSGFLLFTLQPLRDLYVHAMNAAAGPGVARESPVLWATSVGALSYGALVTLAVGAHRGPTRIGAGIRAGGVVGLLLWLTANFMLFAISNVGTLATTIAGSLIEVIPGAIAGALVALVLGGRRTIPTRDVAGQTSAA